MVHGEITHRVSDWVWGTRGRSNTPLAWTSGVQSPYEFTSNVRIKNDRDASCSATAETLYWRSLAPGPAHSNWGLAAGIPPERDDVQCSGSRDTPSGRQLVFRWAGINMEL